MNVIINADDLGASREVNDAIFGMMSKGRVTSATMLANGPAFSEAAARVKDFPHCSFGVHMNATEWKPLTANPDLKPILDQKGRFAGNRLREIKIDQRLRTAVFQEWSAQIERARSAGVPVSHLDSHHHMHTAPALFTVLKQVQERFGIRKVRQTMNVYSAEVPASKKLRALKALWNTALRTWYPTKTTDRFTSLAIFHSAAQSLPRTISAVELMVHPGGKTFTDETALLSGEWWRDLPFAIRPISYNEL